MANLRLRCVCNVQWCEAACETLFAHLSMQIMWVRNWALIPLSLPAWTEVGKWVTAWARPWCRRKQWPEKMLTQSHAKMNDLLPIHLCGLMGSVVYFVTRRDSDVFISSNLGVSMMLHSNLYTLHVLGMTHLWLTIQIIFIHITSRSRVLLTNNILTGFGGQQIRVLLKLFTAFIRWLLLKWYC